MQERRHQLDELRTGAHGCDGDRRRRSGAAEKAILAILFAWMALKQNPAPVLTERRGWAQAGIAMGAILLAVVPAVLLLNLDRLRLVVDALMKLQDAK